jgi:predicted nuclease of predicted toxin-antitoxin system
VRFLLDENFPRSVSAFLPEKGHEVIDLRVVGLLGASDAVVA